MTEKDKTTDALPIPFEQARLAFRDAYSGGVDLDVCLEIAITAYEMAKQESTPTPSREAVPDGEIHRVMEMALINCAGGDYIEQSEDIIEALREHFNITITRKE